MTSVDVNDVLKRTQSTANGSTTDFSFSFQVNATSEIKVYEDSTLKTEGTHYDIVDSSASAGLNANGTGVVKFKTSPTDYTPANNKVITILSVMSLARSSVYSSGGNITAGSLETDFDRLHRIAGDFLEVKSRTVIAPEYSATNVDMTLPAKATRAGKLLGFNSSTGNPEATFTVADGTTLASVTADIATLADIEDGTDATDAISTLAPKATQVGLLGNSTTVSNMNLLGVSGVITDMNLLGVSAVITDMDLLATSANITAMGHLGTSANVTAMGLLGTSTVVADLALLGTSDVIADMALLANSDVIADMALLADSDVISDMNTLATSDIVSDLNTLATSDIVSDLNTLATSDIVSDLNKLATDDIVSDLNTLATTDIVNDLNTLATSDIVSDINALATSAIIEDLNLLANSSVIADMATLAGSGANPNITSVTASGSVTAGNIVVTEDGTITFEGATDNTNETTLTVADPSADRTITLPNATGTVVLADATQTLTNKSIVATQLTGTVANARLDQQLQDVAGLAVTNGNFIVGDGSNFVAENGAPARTSLGLGTSATTDTGISNGNVPVFTSGVADDDFLRVNGTNIEGRSASEVATDIGAVSAGFAIAMAVAL